MELTLFIIGILLGVFGVLGIRRALQKKSATSPVAQPQIQIFLENLKSIGELVVFKAFTKEIVTAADHWLNEFGKKYLTWLISNKKMAMVFAFEISFWYDLRSPDFDVTDAGLGKYIIKMPKCLYDISIKDISFYDEQRAKVLPWLFPGLLAEALGRGPSEEDRNRLKDEALKQASNMAEQLIQRLSSEIEKSAQQTMEMLAKSFGATTVILDFSKAKVVQRSVTDTTAEQAALN
jgi:hypothetical protein